MKIKVFVPTEFIAYCIRLLDNIMSNIEHSSVDIKLRRIDKTYRLNEVVDGNVLLQVHKGWSHNGIILLVEGTVVTTHSSKGLANDVESKTLTILKSSSTISPAGKFIDGEFEVPFSFTVAPIPSQVLFDTYRGIYISVVYTISVICDRGVLKKALKKEIEFIVEVPSPTTIKTDSSLLNFTISPNSLDNVQSEFMQTIPNFLITGKLHKTNCPINEPLTGEFTIDISVAPIRSVELQLVRVETVRLDQKEIQEASEIMRIQIGDGNICRSFLQFIVFKILIFIVIINILETFLFPFTWSSRACSPAQLSAIHCSR